MTNLRFKRETLCLQALHILILFIQNTMTLKTHEKWTKFKARHHVYIIIILLFENKTLIYIKYFYSPLNISIFICNILKIHF